MKIALWKMLIALELMGFLIFGMAGCSIPFINSGGSGGSPAAEYLWEFSLTQQDLFIATIDSSTGQLGAPMPSGGIACNSTGPIPTLAVAPSKKFVFVIDECLTSIHTYSLSASGQLQEISKSPIFIPGDLESLEIAPTGNVLFAVGSNPDVIYELAINGGTGELTSRSTTMEAGADARSAVMDPTGKFIYWNDLTGGRIFAYATGGNGPLSPLSGSPVTVPSGGRPSNVFMVGGKFLYAPLISGGIAGFAVNSSTGGLTNIPGSPFPTTSNDPPPSVVVGPSGRFLYTVGGNLNTSVEGFSIDATTGALAMMAGSPFTTQATTGLGGLAVDNSGNFLYATVYATTLPSSTILGFAINASNGSLTALPTSPYPAAPFPVNVVGLSIP